MWMGESDTVLLILFFIGTGSKDISDQIESVFRVFFLVLSLQLHVEILDVVIETAVETERRRGNAYGSEVFGRTRPEGRQERPFIPVIASLLVLLHQVPHELPSFDRVVLQVI